MSQPRMDAVSPDPFPASSALPMPVPAEDLGVAHVARPPDHRAALMLAGVTLLWGLSFPLMKRWQLAAVDCPSGTLVASATIIALRSLLALPVVFALHPRLVLDTRAFEHRAGAITGLVFFCGFFLQVVGIAWTTPALSGFLTSLGCAWVPLMAWLCWRIAVPGITLVGIAMGLAGVAVLFGIHNGFDAKMGWGDGLTLISSVLFAVQILVLDRLGRHARPGTLTVSFLAVTGLFSLVLAFDVSAVTSGVGPWLSWTISVLQRPGVLIDVLVLTLLCTVLAFHGMNTYQPRISASRAALIYLLEPVFASAFSVRFGYDELSWRLLLGGTIILGGNLLVELPGLLRERMRSEAA
jgi:drug/metabolite transporter (DMT)-like permease